MCNPGFSRHSSSILARVWMVVFLLALIATTTEALGQTPRGGKPPEKQVIVRGFRWAVNDLMRLYEAVRLVRGRKARSRLVERMRVIMDRWVTPLERATRHHHSGKVPVQCSPDASIEEYGCLAKSVALAHIYYGMARGLLGQSAAVDAELVCAERLFPGVRDVQIIVRRPPRIPDEFGADLTRVPVVTKLVQEAVRDERVNWPAKTRPVTFEVIPRPSPAKKEARWYLGPPIDLKTGLIIVPEDARNPLQAFYSKLATRALRRTLKRLYAYKNLDTDNPAVCPDPRAFYLPPGKYTLYSTSSRDLPQKFDVGEVGNHFVLEHFARNRTPARGPAPHRVSWYPRPCIGSHCRSVKSTSSRTEPVRK